MVGDFRVVSSFLTIHRFVRTFILPPSSSRQSANVIVLNVDIVRERRKC